MFDSKVVKPFLPTKNLQLPCVSMLFACIQIAVRVHIGIITIFIFLRIGPSTAPAFLFIKFMHIQVFTAIGAA
jgi:hypothetical protein